MIGFKKYRGSIHSDICLSLLSCPYRGVMCILLFDARERAPNLKVGVTAEIIRSQITSESRQQQE